MGRNDQPKTPIANPPANLSASRTPNVRRLVSRLDVLGFERLEYELTPDAINLELDAALPQILGSRANR